MDNCIGRVVSRDIRVTFRFYQAKKKADVVEHPKALNHVGLLINGPVAAATCPSFSRPTI